MIEKPVQAYVYRCRLDRVVDGDTVDLVIDVGFRLYTTQRVRLAGVDTPETRGVQRPAGLVVTRWVRDWFDRLGPDFLVETGKDSGAYGRWVGDVWAPTGEHVNGQLLATGLAKLTTSTRASWTTGEIKEISER